MAAVTATALDTYTPIPGPDGTCIEIFRTASATVGDTCVLVPRRGRFVKNVLAPGSNNLSTSGGNTNVTVTISATGVCDITLYSLP